MPDGSQANVNEPWRKCSLHLRSSMYQTGQKRLALLLFGDHIRSRSLMRRS